MKPLIDGDILLHEIGWTSQFKDKDTGEEVLLSWEETERRLDEKIRLICEDVGATEPPTIFITSSEWTIEQENKRRKLVGEPLIEFVQGFRYNVAKTQPYKGNRKNPKPFHFYNICGYLMSEYDNVIADGGLEADDLLSITQCEMVDKSVICSRDKDLRICPGYHFSWECGSQKAIGPVHTDRIGWLEKTEKGDVLGYGLKFFYYQMLVGDTADHIPGCKGVGKVGAYKLLDPCTTEEEMFVLVKDMYKQKYGEQSKDMFLEQANLLWIWQTPEHGYKIPKFS